MFLFYRGQSLAGLCWMKTLALNGLFTSYANKLFRKTNTSYPLIRTLTCGFQGVRNVSFLENFANILNKLSQTS